MNGTLKRVYYEFKEGVVEASTSDLNYALAGASGIMATANTKKVGVGIVSAAYTFGFQMLGMGLINVFVKEVTNKKRREVEE